MRCYDIRNWSHRPGILFEADPNNLTVSMMGRGRLYFELSPQNRPFIQRFAGCRLLMDYVKLQEDGRLLLCSKETSDDGMALIRLDVKAGSKGNVRLSANSNSGEFMKNGEVQRWSGPFPPMGVDVLWPKNETVEEWEVGKNIRRVLLTMLPGSSFKIFRGGHDTRHRESVIWWNGEDLIHERKNPSDSREKPLSVRPPNSALDLLSSN